MGFEIESKIDFPATDDVIKKLIYFLNSLKRKLTE